ncbi:MAG: hypothetical protein NTW95_09175 [Candidatus Aminicenantes bacterium]|nr:hypothetical protein [Candidatus Aminicenantes bacterium]
MKKTIPFLAFVILLAAAGATAGAEIFKNHVGGVSVWFPDGWEIDSEEEIGALYADAPHYDAFCVLQLLLKENNLPGALRTYNALILKEEVDDFNALSDVRQGELNGMTADFFSGEGQRDDKTWTVEVALIVVKESVLLCAIGWEKDKREQYAPLRDRIFPSIKKLD